MELKSQNLTKKYSNKIAVQNLSITLSPGEILGLLGPNGAGKSTISRLLFRFYDVTSGQIRIDGQGITDVSQTSLRQALGIVPQDTVLFNDTLRNNLLYACPDASEADLQDVIQMASLDRLVAENPAGLETVVGERGLKLSGGEKRRVEIVRALATDPAYILLDEPFAGIDPIAVSEIQHIIHSLKEKGLGIVISDHNVRETLEITDRAYIIHQGKLILSGTSEEVVDDPLAKKFYLGENFSL